MKEKLLPGKIWNNFGEMLMKGVFGLCALVSTIAIVLICWFLIQNALPAFEQIGIGSFLFGKEWDPSAGLYGIWPMIIGSIEVSILAMAIGVPLGLGSAVFLVYFCPEKLQKVLGNAIDLLAGIPSVVYGLFGLLMIVPIMQWLFGTNGKGVLTAAIVLGIMIIPTIASVSKSSLKAIDPSLYENARALGCDHERAVFKICLKAAKSGILASIVLGLGRAVGETMAVLMVAGNAAVIPGSILSNVRTLTTNIVLEMGYAQGLHREALIATAFVLLCLVFVVNLSFQAMKNKEA